MKEEARQAALGETADERTSMTDAKRLPCPKCKNEGRKGSRFHLVEIDGKKYIRCDQKPDVCGWKTELKATGA